MTRRRHTEQGGYALIFIFALAAMFSLALYVELPRLALEMQRNREEMLVERGEQYARAIKVFVRKNSKYPQTIEELESFNGKRFLRRRYPDPLTGKDEWRLIHVDASGRFTDSLVQPAAAAGQTQQEQSVNTFTGGGAQFGSTGDPNAQRVPQALQRRQSDQPGAAGQMGAPELQQAQVPVDSSQPGAPPPPPNQFGPPGTFQPGLQPFPQQPGQFQPGGPQPFPQQPVIGPNGQPIRPIAIPGLPGASPYPTQPSSSQTGGTVPQQVSGGYSFGSGYSGGPTPQQPQPFNPGAQPQAFQPQRPGPGSGSQSFGNSATPPGLPVNPAAQMIQQLLTTPNPRGLQQAGLQTGSVGLGGGIAGVASKVDAEGIKIYKEKTNYKEWEFVYDPTKDQQRQAGQQQPGLQQPGLQQPGLQQPGLQQPGLQAPGFGPPRVQ